MPYFHTALKQDITALETRGMNEVRTVQRSGPKAVTAPLPRGGQMPGSLQLRQVEGELGEGEQVFSP